MGTFLLHDAWIQFYLAYVGALLFVYIWDWWHNPADYRRRLDPGERDDPGCRRASSSPVFSGPRTQP
jgi:hypothetical protein